MGSVDGLAEVHMSGARAVFTTKDGGPPDEPAIEAAFEERGMQVTRLDHVERPRAKAVYLVDSGIT